MSVAGNETSINSLGGQSSANVAGVPMKKRRFIWPSSPTPEERSSSQVENGALEKQNLSPSQESKPSVTSLGLYDTNKGFALEENKKGSGNNVPTNGYINNSSFKIQEARFAFKSDSLAKSDDDEKLVVAEKSANFLTGIKPLVGIPMKKRRFVGQSAPPHENPSFVLAENDSRKKEHDRLYLETAPSIAIVGESSSGLSDLKKKDLSEKNKMSDSMVHASGVHHSRVKIEEACPMGHSDYLAKLDNKKLLTTEKDANVIVKFADTLLNLAPKKAATINVGNEQIAGGNSKGKSVASGNHELSLGLAGSHHSASETNGHDSSWKQGNIEFFSLNLSLSNCERNFQRKADQVPSDTSICNLFADRSNWDLNTTMDAWEASADEGTSGQVIPDAKPLMSIGAAMPNIATEKRLFGERECRTGITRTLSETGRRCNAEDSLHLRLSPSLKLFNRHETYNLSANKDSRVAVPNISLPKELSGSQTINSKIVKSEPVEEGVKNDLSGSKANLMSLLRLRAVPVKSEYVEKLAQEGSKLPNSSPGQSMKSEPIHGDNLVTLKTTGMSRKSDKEVLQSHDAKGQSSTSTSEHVLQGQDIEGHSTYVVNKCMLQVQDTTGQCSCSTNEHVWNGQASEGKSNCSTNEHGKGLDQFVQAGLAIGVHFKNEAPKESCESAEKRASEMSAQPVGSGGDEIKGFSELGPVITDEKIADISEPLELKSNDELPLVPQQNGECAEEKINLSGDILEEGSCGSEYESDGNSVPMNVEEDGRGQDDYEDGEVCESQPDGAVEGPVCKNTEDASHGDFEYKELTFEELNGDLYPSSSDIEGKDSAMEQLVKAKKDAIVDEDTTIDRKTISSKKDASLEDSSAVDISSDAADEKKVVKRNQGNMLDLPVNKDERLGTEQSSDQPASRSQETSIVAPEGMTENVKMNDLQEDDSVLHKVETSVNVEDAAEDAISRGNQSRIINLPIASNMSSFGKARTISGKPFSLHPGGERLPDVPLEGERLHLRGREDAYTEGSHKFSRERYQDQSSRNSRWNHVRGRGRIGSRIDSAHSDRNFERDCVPRRKYTFAVNGSDTDYNMNYNIGQDGGFGNNVRGGRKLLDDETQLFRQFSSKRRSPGTRDGPTPRGLQMREFPDDSEEQLAYGRPQRPFEGLDGRFVQGTRNFSALHKRGMPQMHSKSPIRSRSPGPWSSRRSPDGFGGPPELHHRRSPSYRMERIRSPNNACFPAGRVPRRNRSPLYMARPNELREMDPSRTPNGRVFLRNNRRFNIVDHRERVENEEFFGGPTRFHELVGDGNGEERKRFDERRAHVHPFRPFNGADSENFHQSAEDGPRSFRYFQEEFHEQRAREFDRRIKNRPGNGPRRPRSLEEQEGTYRRAGKVMNDAGFEDMSRVKRERF